jgi:hypothetical protein
MDWLQDLLDPSTLIFLIPLAAIIGGFAVAALKAHHTHLERIEKIRQGHFDI